MATEFKRHPTATASGQSELSSLLERYHRRFEAGETLDHAEIRASHPDLAAEIWRNVIAWRAVARFLPGGQEAGHGLERKPAIRFQSIEGGRSWLDRSLNAEELARHIAERGESIRRYEVVEEIARGAMGAILRVTDLDLGRDLAMKVRLAPGDDVEYGTPANREAAATARFVEEARLTAALEHPHIPAVHDFGVDEVGNFYFTMPWVRGKTLREVFTEVRGGSSEWTLPRALNVLLQVGDALEHAHANGVIHRDLKPRNVMVVESGEAYLMDWGLAHDMNRADLVDLRIESDDEQDDESPITTRDGAVIGTPCYMSPEQARGDVELIGPQSDVYALGAILYELLCGHPPYAPSGSKNRAHQIVSLVRNGPPASVVEECPGVPADLAAVCSRAMAREVTERYADVREMTAALRGCLKAHAPVQNRDTLTAALLLVLVFGVIGLLASQMAGARFTDRELAFDLASELLESESDMGALGQGGLERRRSWLERATSLVAELPSYEQELAEFEAANQGEARLVAGRPMESARRESQLRNRQSTWTRHQAEAAELLAVPGGDEEPEALAKARLEREIRANALRVVATELAQVEWEEERRRKQTFVDPRKDLAHRRLHELVWNMRELSQPDSAPMALMGRLLWAWQHELPALQQASAEVWKRARASIADEGECPLYEGLDLAPVLGLVPLGRTGAGLWEFWHPLSGERPEPDGSGGYIVRPETGLVFVLVPGGARAVGVQSDDPEGPNYCDPAALKRAGYGDDDLGVRVPRLRPYFLSKYELTQSQWYRLTGQNPSGRFAGSGFKGAAMCSLTCPVEQVSWDDCRALADWGLALPTEAQFEVAGRADTEVLYWWGDAWPPPDGTANFHDRALAHALNSETADRLPDDGAALHVPVDGLAPNPWGFHHILGNVAEWCRDPFAAKCYEARTAPETGELLPDSWSRRPYRGGSWFTQRLALTRRRSQGAEASHDSIGVRPVFEGLR